MKKLTDNDIAEFDRMIKKIANKYFDYANFNDLVSEGYVGLCEAAQKWQEGKGTTFRGFAYRYIRGRIHDYLRKENSYKEVIELDPFM